MDNTASPPAHRAYMAVAVSAAIGAGFGAWALLAPETGVTGTAGAMLALFGAVAVTLCALVVVQARPSGRGRPALDALMGVGAALTAFAAWMLMQPVFTLAMIVAMVAVVIAALRPNRRS